MLNVDPWAFLLLSAALFLLWHFRKFFFEKPALLYPSLGAFRSRFRTWREKWSGIPSLLYLAGLSSLLLAFCDPHYFKEDTDLRAPPREGLAIFLIMDRSGSMGRIIDHEWKDGQWQSVTEFDFLKKFSSQFVARSKNDLIGIVAFARSAQIVSPLTLDHKSLQEKIEKLSIVQDKEQDGTAMGYAIYKTAHLITALKAYKGENAPYDIKRAVMILVTDGLQDPSLLDRGNPLRTMGLEEAGSFLQKHGIRLYIVHVGNRLNEQQFALNKREMERLVQSTGGKLIVPTNPDELERVLNDIQKLEKSQIYGGIPEPLKKVSLFPYLLLLGLSLIGASILLNTTVWRRAI
jgi:Ca-activated chloride channel family protein